MALQNQSACGSTTSLTEDPHDRLIPLLKSELVRIEQRRQFME